MKIFLRYIIIKLSKVKDKVFKVKKLVNIKELPYSYRKISQRKPYIPGERGMIYLVLKEINCPTRIS